MDFSVHVLHGMEKDIHAEIQKILKVTKTSTVSDLTQPTFMKLSKDSMAGFLKSFVQIVEKNLEVCKMAADKIDQLKNEQIEHQKEIIKAQQTETNSVQNTVKNELKSWAEVARINSKQNMTVSAKTVKEAVKTTLAEDDRSRNFMMYGLEEAAEGQEDDLVDAVRALCEKTEVEQWPRLCSAYRMGEKRLTKLAQLKCS